MFVTSDQFSAFLLKRHTNLFLKNHTKPQTFECYHIVLYIKYHFDHFCVIFHMVQTDKVYLNEGKPDIENGICIDFCCSQLYKTDLGHIYLCCE